MDDLREVHISLLNIHDPNASLVLKNFECMEYVTSNSGYKTTSQGLHDPWLFLVLLLPLVITLLPLDTCMPESSSFIITKTSDPCIAPGLSRFCKLFR